MRYYLFVIAIILCLSTNSISARPHFFPNVSAIPPSLLPNATASAWHSFQKFNGCHAGDKVDGLAKLKQYFHNFGYITNSTSNFTDDFDDALESALKTYQRNFNLNTTGELDDSTLQQIVRPRCGNADIVNGSTSMNSGNKSSSSSSQTNGHFHTVAHYTFFENMPRWPEDNQNLSYAFLPANQLSDEAKAVFSRAFARWAEVTPLTFYQTDSYITADIKIGFYTGDHGDGEAFDGVLGTLAHAFSPTSGRFHLDGDETWVVGDISSSTVSTAIDLESVAVHEIGHLLGLGHSSVEEAIMYPTITSGERKVELASDDVEGIQVLYGSNPNNNGTSTTASQEKDTSGSGTHTVVSWWGLKILFAVGFVLLMM